MNSQLGEENVVINYTYRSNVIIHVSESILIFDNERDYIYICQKVY